MNFMKKLITIIILTTCIYTVNAQNWSDDLGMIDSLHIGGDVAMIEDLFNDGDSVLYIGGSVKYVNTEIVNQILKWDGYNYYLMQDGINHWAVLNTIARYKNLILVGGDSQLITTIPNTWRLASWNGTNWQSVSSEWINGEIKDFAVSNDTLYIAGRLNKIGNDTTYKVAAFHNGSWIHISKTSATFGNMSSALEIFNNELYAAHYSNGIRKFLGGIAWEIHEEQPNNYIWELKTDSINSLLYICGGFSMYGDMPSHAVVIWDGFNYQSTGTYCSNAVWEQAAAIYRGDLFIGGGSYYENDLFRAYITRWNGESWDSIGGAFMGNIKAMEVFRDTLYIGGNFRYWGGDSPIPDKRSKGLVKLYIPDNGCHYLKPRINTYADTFYLNGGEAVVNLYNNNPYVDSWEWNFGDSQTGSERNPVHTYTQVGEYNVQVTVTDGECVKTANKTIYIELGNEVPQFEKIDMQVHPNPSSNDFRVKVTLPNYQNAEIKIAGINGHLKDIIPVNGETTIIPTKGWSAGVYVCNLFINGNLVKVEKLVFE